MVRFAPVADRGIPPPRDPRGYAEEEWFCPARARRRHGQERDLRLQRGALLQARSARRTPANARGRDCEAEGCLYRGRPCRRATPLMASLPGAPDPMNEMSW